VRQFEFAALDPQSQFPQCPPNMPISFDDPPEKIVADAKRYREDAIRQLEAINSGRPAEVMVGRTKEAALRILNENIAIYDHVINIWQRNSAHRA
jgi:hypothetical protein